jgi:hypothetical protein
LWWVKDGHEFFGISLKKGWCLSLSYGSQSWSYNYFNYRKWKKTLLGYSSRIKLEKGWEVSAGEKTQRAHVERRFREIHMEGRSFPVVIGPAQLLSHCHSGGPVRPAIEQPS